MVLSFSKLPPLQANPLFRKETGQPFLFVIKPKDFRCIMTGRAAILANHVKGCTGDGFLKEFFDR